MTFIFLVFLSCAVGSFFDNAVYGCLTFGGVGLLIMATNKWVDWQ